MQDVREGKEKIKKFSNVDKKKKIPLLNKIILFIFGIFVVLVAVGNYYIYLQTQRVVKDSVKTTHSLQQLIASNNYKLSQIETKFSMVEQKEDNIEKVSSALNQELIDLESKVEVLDNRTRKISTNDLSKWQMAEALYLIKRASLTLELDKDPNTAIKLLDAADQLILSLDDMKLTKIRTAIAKDKQNLLNVDTIDVMRMWFEIDNIISKLKNLPVSQPRIQDSNVEKENKELNKFIESFAKGWHELKDLIKIRRINENFKPILSETEQSILEEVLRLKLEQMKWALMHHNVKMYKEVADTTYLFLDDNFSKDSKLIVEIKEQLLRVKEINIDPNLPKLTNVIDEIANFEKTLQG